MLGRERERRGRRIWKKKKKKNFAVIGGVKVRAPKTAGN